MKDMFLTFPPPVSTVLTAIGPRRKLKHLPFFDAQFVRAMSFIIIYHSH